MAWNKPGEKKVEVERKGGQRSVHLKGLIAGAIVVLGALCFFLFSFSGKDEKLKAEKKPGMIKEIKPASVSKSAEELVREQKMREVKLNKGERVAQPRERKAIRSFRSPADRYREARASGARPIFQYESERFLAMYCQPGEEVPPAPIDESMKQDFIDALVTPIVVSPEDPPDVIQKKEMVAAMKTELKQFIKDGGTFVEFFKELDKRQRLECEIKNDAQTMLSQMLSEDDDAVTVEFWRKANANLAERGISQLPLHPRLRNLLPQDELEAYDAARGAGVQQQQGE